MRTKRSLLMIAALILVAAVVGTAASEGAGGGSKHTAKGLAGAWNAVVRRPAPLPPIASLQVYTKDGSVIETSDEPPASRTTQIGTWKRIGDHLYAASALVFRFDQTGNHVATIKINRNIRVSAGRTVVHGGGQGHDVRPAGERARELPRDFDGRADAGRADPGHAVTKALVSHAQGIEAALGC